MIEIYSETELCYQKNNIKIFKYNNLIIYAIFYVSDG